MKALTIILILTVLTVKNSSYLIKVPTEPVVQPNKIVAPVDWVHLQELVLPLFDNVCEESNDPVVNRLAQSFTFDATDGEYSKPDVITNIQKFKSENGFLPKGEIFTEYNLDHLNELRTVYEVMYYAKNFDTFYKVAAWARQNLNCGLFVNAIYLAIQNRRDTDKLSVPGPYEVLPNYFIQKDVILQASKILANEEVIPSENIHDDGNSYTLDANYTAIFYDNNDESKLAYFREDIGLNSYYFLRKLKEAPWLNTDINGRYGENMYQMMKQFMARYNLERYSNGLPELNDMDWNSSLNVPYDPMLIYSNGNEFIHRTGPVQLPDNDDVALLRTIEENIGEVVNHIRDGGYNKTQILNHLMEILVTGDKSYENLAHRLLGKDQTDKGYPSVLEHYMTSLRDPMFWIINKKMVEMVDKALQFLPPYSANELFFPGVEIMNIGIKKMMTMFEYYEFDVTDALKISGDNTTFQVKIGQPRLNHKPFNIKINISSLVSNKGLIKIYLGPKVAPGELAIKKNSFVLIDVFEYNFKIGTNIITRTSDDMKQFSKDYMSLRTIRKKVQFAEFGLDALPLLAFSSQMGYPDRLILPKGTFNGLPLQLFVFVAPFVKSYYNSIRSQTDAVFNSAIMSPGYPLDLTIDNNLLLGLPNAMLKDVLLTHKGDSKVENYDGSGVTKKWYGTNNYDPSVRTTKKEPFDYASKTGQYSNKGENKFENKNNGLPNQDFSPLENTQDVEEVIQNSDSSVLLAPKAGIDYSGEKIIKQKSFNYNPNKGDFITKLDDEKLLYKYKPKDTKYINTVQDNNIKDEVDNKKPITGIIDYFQDDLMNTDTSTTIDSGKHLLGAVAGFDYAAKKKEREYKSYNFKPNEKYGNKGNFSTKREYGKFDYKAIKDQYNIKQDNGYNKDLEEINNSDFDTEVLENLMPTVNMFVKNENNDINRTIDSTKEIINTEEKTPVIDDNIHNPPKDMYKVPLLKLGSPNTRKFSVYDYIFHVLDDDDSKEKVYS